MDKMIPFNNQQLDPNQPQTFVYYYQPQMTQGPITQLSYVQAQQFYLQQQQHAAYMSQQLQMQPLATTANKHQLPSNKKKEDEKLKFKAKATSDKVDIDSFTQTLFNRIETKPMAKTTTTDNKPVGNHHDGLYCNGRHRLTYQIYQVQCTNIAYYKGQRNESRQGGKAANWNESLSGLFVLDEVKSDAIEQPLEPTDFVAEWPVEQANHQLAFGNNQMHSVIGKHQEATDQMQIPAWCVNDSVPLVYKQVYDAVKSKSVQLLYTKCASTRTEQTLNKKVQFVKMSKRILDQNDSVKIDTDQLYTILILSKIEKSVLAKLWSLVNRTIPGQLVKHELYMMLALVALAQMNVPFESADVLNSLVDVPSPSFDLPEVNIADDNVLPSQTMVPDLLDIAESEFQPTQSDEPSIAQPQEDCLDLWADFQSTAAVDGFPNGTIEHVDLFSFDSSATHEHTHANIRVEQVDLFAKFNQVASDHVMANLDCHSDVISDQVKIDETLSNEDLSLVDVQMTEKVHCESEIGLNNLSTDAAVDTYQIDVATQDKYSFFTDFNEVTESENCDKIWLKCLQAIKFLYENVYKLFLDFCANFDGDAESECFEIAQSSRGSKFIECIRLDPKTASCVNEIDKIYKDLCILWKCENNQSIQDNPNPKPNQPYCSLCLHGLNASYVQFSSNLYHSTCINYWLNCVDPNSFPNLRIP